MEADRDAVPAGLAFQLQSTAALAHDKRPSCPSGRHKPQSFIGTKTLRSCNPDTKNFKINLNTVPKNDRMHSLVKEQKKSTFTVHFLGPSGGTKMRPQNRKIHSKGRPLQKTKTATALFKQPAYRFGTEEARTCEA